MPVPICSPFRSRLVQAPSVAGALAILSGMFAPVKAYTALYTVTDLGSLGLLQGLDLGEQRARLEQRR